MVLQLHHRQNFGKQIEGLEGVLGCFLIYGGQKEVLSWVEGNKHVMFVCHFPDLLEFGRKALLNIVKVKICHWKQVIRKSKREYAILDILLEQRRQILQILFPLFPDIFGLLSFLHTF